MNIVSKITIYSDIKPISKMFIEHVEIFQIAMKLEYFLNNDYDP